MDNIELHINEKNKVKTEVIDSGILMEYLFGDVWKESRVSEVHYDDIYPYYSILIEKDNVIIERKTTHQKIKYSERPCKSKLPQLFRRGSMPFKARSPETGQRVSCGQVMSYQ